MTLFAKINENKKVTQVIVAEQDFINTIDGVWIECTNNQPSLNATYNSELNKFIPPQPYPSWILNETQTQWVAPTPYPNDGKFYYWNELNKMWWEIKK